MAVNKAFLCGLGNNNLFRFCHRTIQEPFDRDLVAPLRKTVSFVDQEVTHIMNLVLNFSRLALKDGSYTTNLLNAKTIEPLRSGLVQ